MKNFEPFDDSIGNGESGIGNREEFSQSQLCVQVRASAPPPHPLLPNFVYLIPVIGFFPSLWTLYHRQGTREQKSVSRLSITLVTVWLLGYLLLASGAATSEFLTLRLLILNSFFTSGYFLVSILLIIRMLQGKSQRLPGFSNLAERWGKHLS